MYQGVMMGQAFSPNARKKQDHPGAILDKL